MNIADLLDPKNDYVFKRIFGHIGNEEITYIQTIEAGEDYEKLKRCIVILITDYDLETLKKIPEYTTKWKIREEKYPKLVLTNVLELYIISLNKAKNSKENQQEELYNWLKFINNPEEETQKGPKKYDNHHIR